MAIKGYSKFLKALALLEPHHQIVLCHIQDTHWGWGLTPLQRSSLYFLQPQPTEQALFGWENYYCVAKQQLILVSARIVETWMKNCPQFLKPPLFLPITFCLVCDVELYIKLRFRFNIFYEISFQCLVINRHFFSHKQISHLIRTFSSSEKRMTMIRGRIVADSVMRVYENTEKDVGDLKKLAFSSYSTITTLCMKSI